MKLSEHFKTCHVMTVRRGSIGQMSESDRESPRADHHVSLSCGFAMNRKMSSLISPYYHSDQMYERSQVYRIAP